MTTKVFEEDEADGLLAAYAIGAVDDSERARVDEYLDEHSEARADVEAYRHAAQQLHSPDGPRPDVWDGINSHITSHDPATRVVQLGDRQARRRSRFPGAIAIAAAAAA